MCPACCFKWHASRRRKASGVLGLLFSFSRISYVPSLLFQVARIPPPKGEWGIRLPLWAYYWHTGKSEDESDWQERMTERYLTPNAIPPSPHPPFQVTTILGYSRQVLHWRYPFKDSTTPETSVCNHSK